MNYANRKAQDLLHTPEGVRDTYGREYAAKQSTIEKIANRIHLYGYEDLQTPSFEYFDVFASEIGTTSSRELFKFFDKEGNTLVLRPDFTPSVARCAAKYYMDEKDPLRFCYQGSAFSNTSDLQGKLKETTQMGAELINDDSAQADGEMIAMLTECLLEAGLTEFQISVGNVEYFKGICEYLGMEPSVEMALRDEISGKNYFAAEDLLRSEGYSKADRDLFLRIRDFMETAEDLKAAADAAPSRRAAEAVERLIDVWNVVDAYGLSKYLSFDLSLLSKYHYYTGIIFKGYTYGTGEPIASGGRYDQLLSYFGKKAPAIGCMISIDPLMEAMRRQHITEVSEAQIQRIYYDKDNYEEALKTARMSRMAGFRTVLLPQKGLPDEERRSL
ncbi:MAG TPA: ATP phosphoribosyltransferase regulatory subunit [Lachnospiraceae bacterium]|nr:ATP phosphoribosyltransferase regulatory subunit [Lachnospiraceae bacterium]